MRRRFGPNRSERRQLGEGRRRHQYGAVVFIDQIHRIRSGGLCRRDYHARIRACGGDLSACAAWSLTLRGRAAAPGERRRRGFQDLDPLRDSIGSGLARLGIGQPVNSNSAPGRYPNATPTMPLTVYGRGRRRSPDRRTEPTSSTRWRRPRPRPRGCGTRLPRPAPALCWRIVGVYLGLSGPSGVVGVRRQHQSRGRVDGGSPTARRLHVGRERSKRRCRCRLRRTHRVVGGHPSFVRMRSSVVLTTVHVRRRRPLPGHAPLQRRPNPSVQAHAAVRRCTYYSLCNPGQGVR